MGDVPLLTVSGLMRSVGGRTLWQNISFEAFPGEIWFIRGPSGIGKTLLLRAIACLDPLEGGCLHLDSRSPSQEGITCWRAQVMYVHQSRVNFKGTPHEFFDMVKRFHSQQGRKHGDLGSCVELLGLQRSVLDQQWSELSGGQAQRVGLAIAVSLQPKVLLLDEPTSACDLEATLRVEAVLKTCSATILWVTHDNLQPVRVGGRVLELPAGTISSIQPNPAAAAAEVLPESSSSSDVSKA